MAAADRDERSDFGNPDAEPWNDEKRTARLIEIVDEYGWPAPDLAGAEVASAAWLIAQHSDADPAFQQRALRLLIQATDYQGKGEHIALLTDRVAANTGKPQTYGSQIGCYGTQPVPDPDLARPDRVDELRAEMDLDPLADYLAYANQHCLDQAQIPTDAGCPPVNGATLLLKPNPVLLVGELHGTNESPAFVAALTCIILSYGLEVTVGLEIPDRETDSVDAFLTSDGGPSARRRLLESPFWASGHPDGRQSTAMLALLDELREHMLGGADLNVLLLDNASAGDHDGAMAQRFLDSVTPGPDGVAVVLTGNAHSTTTPRTGREPGYPPMGHLIDQAREDQTVVAIDVHHSGGRAWVCLEDRACGATPVPGNTIDGELLDDVVANIDMFPRTSADGFHGSYYVGRLSPAEPAAGDEPG